MNRRELLRTLKRIRKLVNANEQQQYDGICLLIWRHYKGNDDAGYAAKFQFLAIAERWPKFSGQRHFPVPGVGHGTAETYCNAAANSTMWSGAYGALRRELLEFAISELEKK